MFGSATVYLCVSVCQWCVCVRVSLRVVTLFAVTGACPRARVLCWFLLW